MQHPGSSDAPHPDGGRPASTTQAATINAQARRAAALVAVAEAPAPFSARDGKLLRLVPRDRRLGQLKLEQQLSAALAANPRLAAALTTSRTATAAAPAAQQLRHVAALLRGWAYLTAGDAKQAQQDARCALAHALRQRVSGGTSTGGDAAAAAAVVVAEPLDEQRPLGGLLGCVWAPAHELASAAHAAVEDWTNAALHAQIVSFFFGSNRSLCKANFEVSNTNETKNNQACQLEPSDPAHAARRAALLPCLPPPQQAALRAGGAAGLVRRLEQEAEEGLPDFLRPHGKVCFETSVDARYLDHPIHRPTDQPTNRPTDQPTNRPTDQPTNRPTDQPTSQTT
jgi:hypothetical protein